MDIYVVHLYIYIYMCIYLQTHNVILPAIKKLQYFVSCSNKDGLEGIMSSEVSQTEKDKCHIVSLICGI